MDPSKDENPRGEDNQKAGSSSLDVFSEDFDPLAALYSSDLTVPAPAAPVFDNVEAFVSKVMGASKATAKTKTKPAEEVRLERQFLPEQMPVQVQRKALPNLYRYMLKQSEATTGGPMSVLGRCVQSGERIRVHVRGINKMRGFAIGTLVAFDKHWNLALVDVDESYVRKRFPKTSMFDVDLITKKFDSLEVKSADRKKKAKKVVKKEEVGCSVGHIVKCRRKTEVVERHVPQVVLRGEHVALVQILT